ncbi:fibronectin type III domain-containing protein [Leptospira limi]|uniref:Fibronectin type III domain-containing protein n=1 Tax=Leptospira limi TaxID=2950023 RepID=A0ABT3LWP0_9LEPT|nr:fibronectin type III domain-containing protein [Leptospira limi]MCW7462139.1 fibronectin type III domain-containing protein [Leptospira limi]
MRIIVFKSLLCGIVFNLFGCIGFIDQIFNVDKSSTSELRSVLGLLGSGTSVGGGDADSSGTTLKSTDGLFTVYIPPDAMNEKQTFEIKKYSVSSDALPGHYIPTTSIYEITPSYRFSKDITISLSLENHTIQSLNLKKSKSLGFSFSSSSESDDSARFPGWAGHFSRVEGDNLMITSRTFSLFGGGTPPVGNGAPDILGAFYYFKPGCSFLPYRVRAQVIEPDGESMTVSLMVGRPGASLNSLPMEREGMTNWYAANIPYESMSSTGITFQIVAVDSNGLVTTRPGSGIFNYPTDSGIPAYISGYDNDRDNDGLNDAWEVDHGFNPNNPSNPTVGMFPDTDGDGIPNSDDQTPNGETNPPIDQISVYPSLVTMDTGESQVFAVNASYLGQLRYVNPSFSTTGSGWSGSPVGNLVNGVFTANLPGAAGVVATIGSLNATATVVVRDSIAPSSITNLSAQTLSSNRIRLTWTSPGNDGSAGYASAYEIRRSTSIISNDVTCSSAIAVAHNLVPKLAGGSEIYDVNGLTPNTQYYFCVRAYDSRGNRNIWNNTVSATTMLAPDTVAPSGVTAFSATALNSESIQLNFNATGDDGSNGAASSYEIRRSTSPIPDDNACDLASIVPNQISPVLALSPITFVVSGLSHNTVYHFCIRGYDDVGNRSIWSGVLTATTPYRNQPPTVNPGQLQYVYNGETVSLNGSGSSDPDAAFCGVNPSSYSIQWSFANKPPTSNLVDSSILNRNQFIASFSPDVPGDYILRLSFTDTVGSCSGISETRIGEVVISVSNVGIWPGLMFVDNKTFVDGNKLYVYGYNKNDGKYYFFVTDGTPGSQIPLTQFDTTGGSIFEIEKVGNMIFFTNNSPTYGKEVWKTDGSIAGTSIVKDANPGVANHDPYIFFSNGTNLFYGGRSAAEGIELWKSDGTASGTNLLFDIYPGSSNGMAGGIWTKPVLMGGINYFTANNGQIELWRTDGTPSGTYMVSDIGGGSASVPQSLTVIGNVLYFNAYHPSYGRELWKTDGTGAGTSLVADLNSDNSGNYAGPEGIVTLGDLLLFILKTPTYGWELWKSDGTLNGTSIIKDANSGSAHGFNSINLNKVGSLIYYTANDGVNGDELWVSDGTTSGTMMLKDIKPGASGSINYSKMVPGIANTVYFTADNGVNGTEVWTSNGTQSGTKLLADGNGLSSSSNPNQLIYHNGYLLFQGTDRYGVWQQFYVRP